MFRKKVKVGQVNQYEKTGQTNLYKKGAIDWDAVFGAAVIGFIAFAALVELLA